MARGGTYRERLGKETISISIKCRTQLNCGKHNILISISYISSWEKLSPREVLLTSRIWEECNAQAYLSKLQLIMKTSRLAENPADAE